MARDELYLALERHATSKIHAAEDLGHLASFGFRGEALPSIASVARVELQSAEAEGAGHRLRGEFGVVKEVLPAPRARGTTVTVRDLFAQLPARRRFLKSTDTEHGHLWGVVTRIALATPQVSWSIRSDRSAERILPSVADAGARLAPLLGERMARLTGFREGVPPWLLRGWLSPPDLSFRDRGHLYIFVNGRSVRDRLLLAALAEAWSGYFAKGAYPAVVLFLELPPEAVDVNVHPTKAEVRFRDPQRIFPWVSGAARDAWARLKGGLGSVLDLPPRPDDGEGDDPPRVRAAEHPRLWREHPSEHGGGALAALAEAFDTRPVPDPLDPRPFELAYEDLAAPTGAAETSEDYRDDPPKFLGAFQDTYLLFESGARTHAELMIIDQHVAHERVLYERLFLRRHAPATQPLLPAKVVQLGPAGVSRLAPFLETMRSIGVEVEAFTPDALVVRALPDFLVDRDPEALLLDLARRIETGGGTDLDAFRRDLNAELACRAAIKKHHRLSPEMALGLLQDLLACEVPHTCPHGRPIIKKLTIAELERSFGRRA
jgi:DNA mismatch repair protein MutL